MTTHAVSEETEEQLAGLESLIEELSSYGIDNERKREIEETLLQFKSQHHAWYLVMDFLRLSNNDHALFYAASVLEYVVESKWMSIEDEDKEAIRSFLVDFLENNFEDCKHFVRNKLVVTLVKIGLVSSGDEFTAFVEHCGMWCEGDTTNLLGLVAVKTIAEECVHSLSNPNVQLLKPMLPQLLSFLQAVLEKVYSDAQSFSRIGFSRRVSRSGSPSSLAPRSSPADSMLQTTTAQEESESLHFNSRSVTKAVTCLEAMGLFFSWVPIADLLTEEVFNILREYSKIYQPDGRIGASAMRCFNEIHSKKMVPPHLAGYVDTVYDMLEAHLMYLLDGIRNNARLNNSVDEDYIDAFIEFLRLFVVNYLARIATSTTNISDLLGSMLQLANSVDYCLFMKLMHVFSELSDLFIEDELGIFVEMGAANEPAFVAVAQGVAQKAFATKNEELADLIDPAAETLDDLYEYQSYTTACVDVVVKICRTHSNESLPMVGSLFIELVSSAFAQIDTIKGGNVSDEDNHVFQLTCADVSCVCKILASVADVFATFFLSHSSMGFEMMNGTLEALNTLMLSEVQHANPIVANVLIVHLLSSLESLCPWLCQALLQAETQEDINTLQEMIDRIMEVITQVLMSSSTPTMSISACSLFTQVTKRIPLQIIYEADSCRQLASLVKENLSSLPDRAQVFAISAICSLYCVKWKNVSNDEQKWDERTTSLKEIVQYPSSIFSASLQTDESIYEFTHACVIVQGISHAFASSMGSSAVRACMEDVQEAVQTSIETIFEYSRQGGSKAPKLTGEMVTMVKAVVDDIGSKLPTKWSRSVVSVIANNAMGCCEDTSMLEEMLVELLDMLSALVEYYEERLGGDALDSVLQLIEDILPFLSDTQITTQRAVAGLLAAIISSRICVDCEQMNGYFNVLVESGVSGDLVLFDIFLKTVEAAIQQNKLSEDQVQPTIDALKHAQTYTTKQERINAALSALQ
eukprot:m.37062 g.37062  ORF g.37062 m.37062 type:complete len:977 (-) comp10131_c0_seq1:105-3035(-)